MKSRRPDRARGVCHLVAAASCALASLQPSAGGQVTTPVLASPPQPDAAQAAKKPKQPTAKEILEADDDFLAGARQLDRNDLIAAEDLFSRSVRLDPSHAEYAQALALARQHRVTQLVQQSGHARLLGHAEEAQRLLAEAQQIDPDNRFVAQHLNLPSAAATFRPVLNGAADSEGSTWSRSPMTIAGPVSLQPRSGDQSFQIRGDSRQAIEQVLSRYGIKVYFDDSLENKNLRFDIENVNYERAAAILFEMTNAFAIPLDSHTVLVAKDDSEGRQRLEHMLEETIYIPGQTTEQMNELGTAVRNVFDVKQTSVQPSSGSMVIRAPEDTLTAINLTLADMIEGPPEVVLDIRLYTVTSSRTRDIGAQLPQQIGVYNVETQASSIVSSNQTTVDEAIAEGLISSSASDIQIALALIASGLVSSSLLSNTIGFFGGGKTMEGITANASFTFNFALNSSDTKELDNLVLRVGDRQAAEFRSGMKYPIMTGSYSTATSTSSSTLSGTTINGVSAATLLSELTGSSSSTTVPQFQYEDLGLIVKATPTVQRSGLVRIKLDLRIEALSGTSLNNIPVLANRQYSSDITVKDGETTLIGSTLSKSEAGAVSGFPGLSELPGFQTATGYKTTETDSSELVILITPRIVRHRSNEAHGPRIAYNQRLPN